MNIWILTAAAFTVATGVSWVTTRLVVRHGTRWGIVDDPATHTHPKVVHERPVPRGGGMPIFAALAIGTLLFMPATARSWGIVYGALLLALTGFADDKYEERVSPYLRLLINVAAALCVIGVGIGIAYVTNPLGGILHLDQPQWCFWLAGDYRCIWVLSDLFALVWLVWMQNIVGWSSGVDGQLPGFVIVAAIVMTALGLRFGADSSQLPVIMLGAITAGAYTGFLPWNWYPQKIIPGYGGKSLAGFLLGVLAILSSAKVGALLMVLGIPVIDSVLVIIKRIKEGRSPVWGGREHLHHLLLDRKWSKKKIATVYWGVSVILGILAWSLQAPFKFYTMAAVLLVITGIIVWLQYWSTSSKQPGPGNGSKTSRSTRR